MEFKLDEYKIFVQSHIATTEVFYKKQNISNQLLESLYQFDVTPGEYLSNIPNPRISEKFKILLKNTNKFNHMPMNNWFIYLYGYKKCGSCKNILILGNYGFSNQNCDKLKEYCKTCSNKKTSEWAKENPENSKIYRLQNKKTYDEYNKKYRLNNIEKFLSYNAKRRANKLQRTPKWLTKDDYSKIAEFYKKAKELTKETNIKYHVDHIIPLQGKTVSGLHVPWNLQVITALKNMQKSNRI
jgi:hypothetical protein